MAKFKVGDRVVLVEHHDDSDAKLRIGFQGTVVKAFSGVTRIGVSWDDLTTGHNCGCLTGRKSNTGLYVETECLKLVAEEAKPEPTYLDSPIIDIPTGPDIDIDDLLYGISDGICSVQSKPQQAVAASDHKPEPKEEEEKVIRGKCWQCAAFQQIADCAYGFCQSWHNFCGSAEYCSRYKAVETVDN